jgi:CubicO group peptidase (beta-lactamase class C family)
MADPRSPGGDAAACDAARPGPSRRDVAALLAGGALALPSLFVSGRARAAGPDFPDRAAAFVETHAGGGLFSGAVIVAEGGRPLFRRAYGLADREWAVPNTPETRFRIGSITKQFTAAAILRLVDEGRLRLDRPVSECMPDLPDAWSGVTARMLLNHSSGIPNLTALPDYPSVISRIDRTPRAVVALLEREAVLFPPGAGHEYSNTGYVLLASLVERVTGLSAARYLGDAILGPLGLGGITDGDPGSIVPRRAAGYAHARGAWRNAPPLAAGVAAGAGDLVASVDDLVAWDRALVSGRVMSTASQAAMVSDYGYGYGLGLYVGTAYGRRLWSHGGAVPGFVAIKDSYPDAGLTVAVLSNTETAPAQAMSRGLAALYFGEPARSDIAIAEYVLARYVGFYRLGARTILALAWSEGRLVMRLGDDPPLALTPESDRVFRTEGGTRLVLDVEPDGRPTGIWLRRDGCDRTGPRIDERAARRLTARLIPRHAIPRQAAEPTR